MRDLPQHERALLDRVQRDIPLVSRPFAALGNDLGLDADVVIETLRRLQSDPPVIRQISAIFDTRALGYNSTLAAARIDPARIEAAAAVISEHPGVSHNYSREHVYNLWYTLAVPPTSRLGLDGTLARLHALSGAAATRRMDTRKVFKIGVVLDVADARDAAATNGDAPSYNESDRNAAQAAPLEDQDIRAIRALQENLPLADRPFKSLAEQAGLSEDALLAAAHRLLQRRQMRRFAAVLRHREAGFAANCMGVWNVPDGRVDAVGPAMARFDAVSHCYLRPRYEDWPYNVFTMVHGRSRDECRTVLAAIASETGVDDRDELWSVQEFKKARVRYFTPEIDAWEREHA
jgi:DNA-binding Lrp family transcriptional regulator